MFDEFRNVESHFFPTCMQTPNSSIRQIDLTFTFFSGGGGDDRRCGGGKSCQSHL